MNPEDEDQLPIYRPSLEASKEAPRGPILPSGSPTTQEEDLPIYRPSTGLYEPVKDDVEAPSDEEPKTSLTKEEFLQDSEKVAAMRNYMVLRKGDRFRDMSDDDVYDTWITHMRWFNTNEVSTAGELLWLNRLEDDKRGVAGSAYQAYDSLGNTFTSDGFWGGVDGMADYVGAVLASPSTYVGGIIGRSVVGGGAKVGQKAAVSAAIKAAQKKALQAAGTAGVTGAASRAIARQAATQVLAGAAKRQAVKQVAVAIGVDSGVAALQNMMYQDALIKGGAKDDYSLLETTLSTGLGAIGGAVAAVPLIAKSMSGLNNFDVALKKGAIKSAAAKKAKAAPAAKAMATKFQAQLVDWADSVQRGKLVAEDDLDIRRVATNILLGTQENPEKGLLVKFMKDAGILISTKEDAPTGLHQMVSFALSLPKKELDDLDATFKGSFGKTYREFVDIVAAQGNEAGNALRHIGLALDEVGKDAAAMKAANNILAKAPKAGKVPKVVEKQRIRYFQSVWRRMLVSHPATTMVNVMGWGQAYGMRTVSELIQGAAFGVYGTTAKLMGSTKFGDEALRQSKHLLAAQVFKMKHLLDPYTTREAAEELFKHAPKRAQKLLSSSVFGGVDFDSVAAYGVNPKGIAVRHAEWSVDKAAKVSLLKAQDAYTKSFSILGEMDKLTRLRFDMSLIDAVDTGKIHDLPDELWEDAIQAALADTLSVDYTKGFGIFSPLANAVETVSNAPVIGFLFPFGRFMNNALAFTMQYSPLSIYPTMTKAVKKGFFAGETQESFSKFLVGSMLLAYTTQIEGGKREEGIAWSQSETGTGSILNRENLAPLSSYRVAGRILSAMISGGSPPEGLGRDMLKQLGSLSFMNDAATPDALIDSVKYLMSLNDDEVARKDYLGFLNEIVAAPFASVLAGFTRPLEPLNAAVGMAAEQFGVPDVVVDRKQLRGDDLTLSELIRYTENIFEPFLGGPLGEPKQAATKTGPVRDENPISRLLGGKVEQPLSPTDRIMAMVDKPTWTAGSMSGVPELDNLLNEVITPQLDARAKYLMASDLWKDANLNKRRRLVETMLVEAHKDAMDQIELSQTDGELLAERKKFITRPESLRKEAKHALGITDDDRNLSGPQLYMLQEYIEFTQSFERDLLD